MKWITGQLQPSLASTLKVIFQVPNSTAVERYIKQWKKCYMAAECSTNPIEKEGISYEVMKLNKKIQAQWFHGPIFTDPEVPIQYYDYSKQLSIGFDITKL